MPMVWTEAAVAKLFLGVLATSDIKLNYPDLAEYMGPECTIEAIRQKMKKLKATEKATENSTSKVAAGTPATNGKSRKVIRSKGTGKRTIDEKIFEDEDSEGTPSKPVRKRVKAKVDAKAGDDGEDEWEGVKEESGAGGKEEEKEDEETV